MKTRDLPVLFTSNFFDEFDRELQPISKMFDELIHQFNPAFEKSCGGPVFKYSSYPKCDIIQYPDKTVIEATVPGLKPEQISLEINGNILTLSTSKQEENKYTNGNFTNKEIKRSESKRSFALTDNHVKDVDNIVSSLENGILSIIIPKIEYDKECCKPKSIKINVKN